MKEHRGLCIGHAALVMGDEAIEVHVESASPVTGGGVDIDFPVNQSGEVDFVDAQEQFGGVFEIKRQAHRIVGAQDIRGVRGKANAGFLLELLELGGIHGTRPAGGFGSGQKARAGVDLG